MKRTIPSSCRCNLKWNEPLPSPSPRPSPSQSPSPSQPYPSPNHFIPSTRPPDRSSSRERSSQIPNDNALFQHVCFATNHGGLTFIESVIILFAKRFCFVHTPHTPCSHHNTAMLNSAVSTCKWAIICLNETRVFRALNAQYRHHVTAI